MKCEIELCVCAEVGMVLSYDFYFARNSELYDRRRGLGRIFIATACAHIVHSFKNLRADVCKSLRRRFAANVGRCGNKCFFETAAQFAAERLCRNSYGYTSVFGNEVGRKIAGVIVYNCKGFVCHFYELPRHFGHFFYVKLHFGFRIYESNQSFLVIAAFYFIYSSHGIGIRGIASQSPNGICGICNDSSAIHYVYCLTYVVGKLIYVGIIVLAVHIICRSLEFGSEMEFDILEILLRHLQNV